MISEPKPPISKIATKVVALKVSLEDSPEPNPETNNMQQIPKPFLEAPEEKKVNLASDLEK